MNVYRVLPALALLTLGAVNGASGRPLEAHAPADYVVVVGQSNAISSLTREQASKLFLKKVATWDDGREVLPVDLPETSRVREAFTKDVMHRSVSAVRAYWQQQIFSG